MFYSNVTLANTMKCYVQKLLHENLSLKKMVVKFLRFVKSSFHQQRGLHFKYMIMRHHLRPFATCGGGGGCSFARYMLCAYYSLQGGSFERPADQK